MEEERQEENKEEVVDQDQPQDSPKKKSNVAVVFMSVIAFVVLLGGMWVAQQRGRSLTMMKENTEDGENSTTSENSTDDNLIDESVTEQESADSGSMTDEELENDDSGTDDNLKEEIEVIEMEGGDYYFDPDVITVKKGKTVKISLTSMDSPFNFVIDEFDVNSETIEAGDTSEITFTPSETGEFEYYSSLENGKELGMVGTLEVTE